MPPDDYDQRPTDHEAEAIPNWIDTTLKAAICRGTIDPGRVTIHRLNRAEYNNTIRDLVGVDFQPADDFPSDDVGYGFDNIGDVLALPPILLEKYLAAAEKIMDRAIVVDDPAKTYTNRIDYKKLQPDRVGIGADGESKLLVSDGEVYGEFNFPGEGTYQIRVQAYGDQAGPYPARMTVLQTRKSSRRLTSPTTASTCGRTRSPIVCARQSQNQRAVHQRLLRAQGKRREKRGRSEPGCELDRSPRTTLDLIRPSCRNRTSGS